MTRIARYIDDQPAIFFWEMDEIIVFTLFTGIGIFFNSLFMMIIIGAVGAAVLGKFKNTQSEGFFLHFLYWYGVFPLRGCIASYKRTLIE
jgi:conjugal transfer pilus assembly protein TraL